MSVNKYVIIFARYTIIIDWKWKLFYEGKLFLLFWRDKLTKNNNNNNTKDYMYCICEIN